MRNWKQGGGRIMTNELPTINIKGKDYVLVKDRILAFNENYPNGSIRTKLISSVDSKMVIVKAVVTPDVKNPTRRFSDYSQAMIGQGAVNMTSALENASTSAVGRALAYMGIGVIESIASADEMNKATNATVASKDKIAVGREAQSNHFCNLHAKPMKERNFDGMVFYDHRMQIDGVWNMCNGTGWKAQQKTEEIPERQIDEDRNDAKEGAMFEETIQ